MNLKTISTDELKDQLDHWDLQMDKYDAAGSMQAFNRARSNYLAVEEELIRRTMAKADQAGRVT